jgi:hypothetical protein
MFLVRFPSRTRVRYAKRSLFEQGDVRGIAKIVAEVVRAKGSGVDVAVIEE